MTPSALRRRGSSHSKDFLEQDTDQIQLLQSLYQEYLTQSIQLREQLMQAQLRIQELESEVNAGTEASEVA